jgi:uncharacterized protein (TIGR03435 family)
MIEQSGRQRSFLGGPCLAAALLAGAACAQTAAPPATQPPTSPAMTPVFEVATVKLDKSGSGGAHTGWRNGTNGTTFTAINVQLKNLIQYQAFGISGPRILGGPKWMDSERFDIEAKMDSAVAAQLQKLPHDQGVQQMQMMFQQLLADRFQLKTHWETRELPVYALVVAKGGPTLEKTKDPAMGLGTSAGNGQLQANSATLADIAQVMTQEASDELGRVVIDKTGIDGKYDIRLKWTPDFGAGSASGPESSAAPPSAGPSIFTAVQEQLGLKLESAKGPVQVLVIDSVAMPSAN